MGELVICNRRTDDCGHCTHSKPHEKHKSHSDTLCTIWEECYYGDDEEGNEIIIKARCVRVK